MLVSIMPPLSFRKRLYNMLVHFRVFCVVTGGDAQTGAFFCIRVAPGVFDSTTPSYWSIIYYGRSAKTKTDEVTGGRLPSSLTSESSPTNILFFNRRFHQRGAPSNIFVARVGFCGVNIPRALGRSNQPPTELSFGFQVSSQLN